MPIWNGPMRRPKAAAGGEARTMAANPQMAISAAAFRMIAHQILVPDGPSGRRLGQLGYRKTLNAIARTNAQLERSVPSARRHRPARLAVCRQDAAAAPAQRQRR